MGYSRILRSRGWCVAAAVAVLCASGCDPRDKVPALSYTPSNAAEIRRLLQQAPQESGGEEAAPTAEPDGWGTLKGKFVVNGTPPVRVPLTVNKDTEVCSPGGKQPLAETVVVGAEGELQNVLVFLTTPIAADNPKWLHESYAEARSAEVLFDQKNCVFLSHVASMWAPQTLKVLNSDPVGHNTNLDSKRGAAAGNFTVAANSSALYQPGKASPAPFPVSCSIHPWMSAWLMVCESPYFAVTAADGTFEIKNLPAGVPLEFRVWQEKANFLQQVTVNGEAQKWNRGRFTVTLAKDEQRDVNVAVDATIFE
ncbi:MAG: hypothetical protein AB7F89_04540 [Pirellulaceae bacterium]